MAYCCKRHCMFHLPIPHFGGFQTGRVVQVRMVQNQGSMRHSLKDTGALIVIQRF